MPLMVMLPKAMVSMGDSIGFGRQVLHRFKKHTGIQSLTNKCMKKSFSRGGGRTKKNPPRPSVNKRHPRKRAAAAARFRYSFF